MITGGKVNSVSASKMKETKNEGFKIAVNVVSVKVEKTKVLITYSHESDYTPDVAKIVINGELQMEFPEKQTKEILDKWNKDKQLPDAVALEMLTGINYTASAVGTLLAFAVGVPAPINVPRAQVIEKPEQQKAG